MKMLFENITNTDNIIKIECNDIYVLIVTIRPILDNFIDDYTLTFQNNSNIKTLNISVRENNIYINGAGYDTAENAILYIGRIAWKENEK